MANLAKSRAVREQLAQAGAGPLLDRVVRVYSQYSDVAADKAVSEWALLAREAVFPAAEGSSR